MPHPLYIGRFDALCRYMPPTTLKGCYFLEPRSAIKDPCLALAYFKNNRKPVNLHTAHALMV